MEVHGHSGIELEGCDVLEGVNWAVQIDDSLVNFHFKVVPGVGSFSAWGSSDGVGELLGWNSDWSFCSELVFSGIFDDCSASGLERVNVLAYDCESRNDERGIYLILLLSAVGSPFVLSLVASIF